eukprot:gene35743-1187_t
MREQLARVELRKRARDDASHHTVWGAGGRAVDWLRTGRERAKALNRTWAEYHRLGQKGGKWDSQVEKDVPRTMAAVQEKRADGADSRAPQERQLRRVLRAWVARSEEEGLGTGYVQGMNFRCALPLHVLTLAGAADDAALFGLCCVALEDFGFPETFSMWPPLAGLLATRQLLQEECRHRVPELVAALGEAGLDALCGLLAPHWLLPLFCGILPVPVLCRVWDECIRLRRDPGGAAVPLRHCVGLLAHFAPDVADCVEQHAADAGLPGGAALDPSMSSVFAFKLVTDGTRRLPADWECPDTGEWDIEPLRRRH